MPCETLINVHSFSEFHSALQLPDFRAVKMNAPDDECQLAFSEGQLLVLVEVPERQHCFDILRILGQSKLIFLVVCSC